MDKKSHKFELDFDQDLEKFEGEIGFRLEEYDVEYPSESEIMMTINAIRPYVPVKKRKWKVFSQNLSSIIKHSLQEIFYISPLFWVTNCLFFIIGLSTVLLAEQNPYLVIMILAPIPTITGLLEVLKSRNAEMAELELSLKYSLQEIILSKMMVVGGFNLAVNVIFTFSVSFILHDVLIWKLMLYWVTPFTVITAISFLVVSIYRKVNGITVGLAVWIAFGSLLSQTRMVEKLESLPVAFYILISVVAALCSIIQMIQIIKRGVKYEFNH